MKSRQVKDEFDNRSTSVPQCTDLQYILEPFDSLKCSTWQGKEHHEMIRTMAVICDPMLVCSKDDGKSAVEKASNGVVMGAVWAFWEFTLLVSQQNHSVQSLKALYNALMRFYLKNAMF